jgi:hypothetical protein
MESKNSYDFYWRLHENYGNSIAAMREKVEAQGYEIDTKKFKKPDFVKLLQRQDRGLLCYNKCSNKELEIFATARKVTCYIDSNRSKRVSKLLRDLTIETLMEADEVPRFEKFLDLPIELRTRIYEMYDADLPETLYLPTKPPLARICHQIREELLPVYLSNHEFCVDFVRYRLDVPVFRGSDQTYIWLSQLSTSDVANINQLKISVRDRLRKGSLNNPTGVVGTIQICLHSNGGTTDGTITVSASDDDNFHFVWKSQWIKRLRREVANSLTHAGMTIRERKRFKLQDIYDLRKAVNAAYE